jgi:trimethylamine--corrinoid protein Co-methyltransferase
MLLVRHEEDVMASLYGTLRPFEDSQLRKIHEASLTILENAGAFIAHDEVLERLADAGYPVNKDQKLVRFPSDSVEQLLTGFSGDLNRTPRGETLSVSIDSGAQNIYDYDTGRPRPVTMRDLIDAPRVADALEHIDEAGTLVMVPDMPFSET